MNPQEIFIVRLSPLANFFDTMTLSLTQIFNYKILFPTNHRLRNNFPIPFVHSCIKKHPVHFSAKIEILLQNPLDLPFAITSLDREEESFHF